MSFQYFSGQVRGLRGPSLTPDQEAVLEAAAALSERVDGVQEAVLAETAALTEMVDGIPVAGGGLPVGVAAAMVDRYGFAAEITRAGGSRYDAGQDVLISADAGGFATAVGDRYGFLGNIVPYKPIISGDYIAAINARAVAVAAQRRNLDTLEVAQPTADWNIILSYGQSLSQGQEAWPALTTSTAGLGLYMLGDSEKPQSETTSTWTPFGTAQLNELKATVVKAGGLLDAAAQAALAAGDQALGEAPVIAAAITARKMWLNHLGTGDDGRRWIVGSCGSGGKTIEELSYGATPDLFNRMVDFVTRVKVLADAAGKTVKIAAVVFLQGEYNAAATWGGSTSEASNLAAREQLRADIQEHVCSIVSQSEVPAWIEYQTGGSFISGAASAGVQMAQLALIDNHRTSAFGSHPAFAVTDKGGHLDPNGSRWLGCLMGRALGHVLTRRQAYWPLTPYQAVQSGREVLISHLVPQGPLQWRGAWLSDGTSITSTTWASKGFVLADDMGAVPIASVEIVDDAVVRIVAARDLDGAATVRLGGPATSGAHNLFDSDQTVLPLAYQYTPGSGQYPAANIPALVGKPYPAQAAAYAYQITARQI